MNYNDAVKNVKPLLDKYCKIYLGEKKDGSHYTCPFCGSGKGAKGTPAFSVFPADSKEKFKCFSCNATGDIVDLIKEVEGITSNVEALKFIYDNERIAWPLKNKEQQPDAPEKNTNAGDAFFLEAHKNIDNTNYWEKRGLTRETIERFNIGFDPEWRRPEAKYSNQPGKPYLIIPTSENSYLARSTTHDGQYSKMKVGNVPPVFNPDDLQEETTVYVVEGEIDCMTITQLGRPCVALGSTTNVGNFLNYIKQVGTKATKLVLLMDGDHAGIKAQKELSNGLKKLNIPHLTPPLEVCYGDYNDPNECYVKNSAILMRELIYGDGYDMAPDLEAEKKEYIESNSNYNYLLGFMKGIKEGVNTKAVKTGFNNLDQALDGGLYEGLYIIGAISSLGKTTYINQIADQIAKAGNDVIIISLEMARNEIIAKSVSRETIKECLRAGLDASLAKTTRGITTRDNWEFYTMKETELINTAVMNYAEYANNIYIIEGVGNIGVDDVRDIVNTHISLTKNKPVLIIDYLQILAPASERASDKQNTDKAVLELKRISRDNKIPVIAISSFNRANYNTSVSMEAFKESGAIEYSSDVLIGMQMKGHGTAKKDYDVNAEKNKLVRDVEVIILKNRNGRTGSKLAYTYYTKFNYFKENE